MMMMMMISFTVSVIPKFVHFTLLSLTRPQSSSYSTWQKGKREVVASCALYKDDDDWGRVSCYRAENSTEMCFLCGAVLMIIKLFQF